MGTHCWERVTPGRSSALAVLRPATRLMKVDFPTLGMPRIITRSVRWAPLASHALIFSERSSRTAPANCFVPVPALALHSSTA